MTTNLSLGIADIVVLCVLAVLILLALKIITGFFKGGKK